MTPTETALIVGLIVMVAALAFVVYRPALMRASQQAEIIRHWEDPLPLFPLRQDDTPP